MNDERPQDNEELLLWRRFKGGDMAAFAEIYRQYVGILHHYGHNLVPESALVQDAIQDLFANLWHTRQRLSDTTSIKYYLFRSLRRQIRQLQSRESVYGALLETVPLAQTPLMVSVENLHIERETEEEQLRALRNALLNLPPRQVEAIRLRFYEEFDFREIAGIMEMNEQSVRNLVQRSLRKLRYAFDMLPVFWMLLSFL